MYVPDVVGVVASTKRVTAKQKRWAWLVLQRRRSKPPLLPAPRYIGESVYAMAFLPPGCLDSGTWSICNSTDYQLPRSDGNVFTRVIAVWPTRTESVDALKCVSFAHAAVMMVVVVLLTCVRLCARRSRAESREVTTPIRESYFPHCRESGQC